MNLNQLLKFGTFFILPFCMALVYGSISIRSGGSIFGYHSNLFYPSLIIAFLFLIAASTLKADYYQLCVAFLLIISLYIITFLGIGDHPFDLDSIISTGSIGFILSQGYPSIFAIDSELFIRATLAYPMLSMIASALKLICGWTDVIAAKNLPIILSFLFILIYFAFIKNFLGFRVALISLIILSTFELMSNVSNTFVNVALANIYIVLGWLTLYRLLTYKLSIINFVLFIYISTTFLLVHHLTLLAYVLSLLAIVPTTPNFIRNLYFNKKLKIYLMLAFFIIIIVGLFSMGPVFSILMNTLDGKYSVIVTPISNPSTWRLELIIQRLSYLLFVLASFGIYAELVIQNRSKLSFVNAKYVNFLIPGAVLFFCSIMTIIAHAPFGYERLAIFGWMLFIPGIICMVFTEDSKNKFKFKSILIAISVILIVVGNIYQIPSGRVDHSGNTEYIGTFKNWVKSQEVDSVKWMEAHDLNNSRIIGDEPIWRLYNMNSPDFNGYWWSGNFFFDYIPEDYDELLNNQGYLFIRQENYYRVIRSFNSLEKRDYRIEATSFDDFVELNELKSIYDNREVTIFLLYE